MRKGQNNKGYSMIVLVIALVIILILAAASISQLSMSRSKTQMMNFIYDLNAIQDKVVDYYIEKGTLPTKDGSELDINNVSTYIGDDQEELRFQLSTYDDSNYYFIDFSQLGALSLKNYNGIHDVDDDIYTKKFFVNGGSLKVYVLSGIEYKSENDSIARKYFTLTPDIVTGQDTYEFQEEEIVIVGNPLSWVTEAKLRVVLPRRDLSRTDWDRWTFKWDHGPKNLEEMKRIPDSDPRRSFDYGDPLLAKNNGLYTVYVKDSTGKESLININVTKIDDINPKYEFYNENTNMIIKDDETGVKEIMYKTLETYNNNKAEAEAGDDYESRTIVDFYLMDGKGKDVVNDLENEITEFVNAKKKLLADIENENGDYSRWISEHPIDGIVVTQEDVDNASQAHINAITNLNQQLTELNEKYPYLADLEGTSAKSQLAIYVEDFAGNSIVIGEIGQISTELIADSFNISLDEIRALQ